ncbi:adhesin [Yersinia intermedia]|uniref:adhesin n=3 Tax=Yersinia intermedia TaxID=631 RepID=UPI0022431FA4|nr:adhesin [Yersinia intermedia]MCW8113716.1 adhesin [Yersinia intermedia]MDA5518448.1 adhesin [Yersinia intermedia]
MKNNRQCVRHRISRYSLGLCLLALMGQSAVADTITIGKGSGIVWEGMPFSATNGITTTTPSFPTADLYAYNSVAYIIPTTLSTGSCVPDSSLTTIAGYKVFKIAPGLGIIPRATVTANYVLANNTTETLSGTIGLPSTQATTSSGAVITNPLMGGAWCLAPRMSNISNFYKANTLVNATVTGTWVMVADGTQTSQSNIALSNVNFTTGTNAARGFVPIFSKSTTIRISTLECTVSTPTQIDFGTIAINLQSGAELSTRTNSLITQCTQDSSVGIAANINVQFRALTGLYGSTPSRLALSQGGGYITGEINNGVTGSGSCTATTGLPFDNTPLKVGNITSTQASQSTSNQVTWRLCSGGSSLPTGTVSAAAEMLVTFN